MRKLICVAAGCLVLVSAPFIAVSPVKAEGRYQYLEYQVPGTKLDRATWFQLLNAAHSKFMKSGKRSGRNIEAINISIDPEVGWIRRVYSQNSDGSSLSMQLDGFVGKTPDGELTFEQRCTGLGVCQNRVIGTGEWRKAPDSARPIELDLSALVAAQWDVELGVDFYVPVPGSFAYITSGSGLANSALVDLKYTDDVLEIRIWEGPYTQLSRVDTNARRVAVIDPTNPGAYRAPALTRAEAENLTPTVLRRQIAQDIRDEAMAKNLGRFVFEMDRIPVRLPLSRWNFSPTPGVVAEWKSFTPKVCRMTTQGRLVPRKAGNCSLGVSFRSGDSGEFRMGKQIRFFR